MDEFKDRLRKARERRYETATEAAKAMRTKVPTYLAHENGSRGAPKGAVLRYSRFFRVDYRWLATGQGTMDGHPIQQIFDHLPEGSQKEVLNFMEFLKNRDK